MLPLAPPHLRHLLARLREVQQGLGLAPAADDPAARLADEVDSMGLVELVAVLAEDCGVRPEAIEQAVGHHFGTVGELAEALAAAGLSLPAGAAGGPAELPYPSPGRTRSAPTRPASCWLTAPVLRLPATVESAEQLDARLNRPAGWLEQHAGIRQRASPGPAALTVPPGRCSVQCPGQFRLPLGPDPFRLSPQPVNGYGR